MTLQQAADHANVDPMTVRRWIKAGKVAATKERIGGNDVWIVADDFVPPGKAAAEEKPTPKHEGPSTDVLIERIKGLDKENELLRQQLSQKDDQIRALLATNARLIEKDAPQPVLTAQVSTTPSPGLFARIFNKQ